MKRFVVGLVVLSAMVTGAGWYAHQKLLASLPILDGEVPAAGLSKSVQIARDEQGIPTINAASRQDIAQALGFLHGQERFFQMDLQRRSAAGELSELFGDTALEFDSGIRVHLFRERAQRYTNALPAEHQALLQAYAAGVNQGLQSLAAHPFEYLLLRHTPLPWKAEDSLLCLYAMYIVLQDEQGSYERSVSFMREFLPDDWFQFLKPRPAKLAVNGDEIAWEAPLQASTIASLSLPATPLNELLFQHLPQGNTSPEHDLAYSSSYRVAPEPIYGSNNWGVGGTLTRTGAAMIANDMHLGLRVPNIWYRAAWRDPAAGNLISGATLPGTPLMVVGSNEYIAWGFTNSYGDWTEVVRLTVDESGEKYLSKGGWQPFETSLQTIWVKDEAKQFLVRQTLWGPVIGEDHNGKPLALRWVAHDQQGANLNLLGMESARNSSEATQVANTTGMPAQNLIVADRNGVLAWTISGPIPRRVAQSEQTIRDSQKDGWQWQGYLQPDDYPVITSADTPRLWSANAQVVGDRDFAKVGDGGYDMGVRAGTIRSRLMEKQQFSERDLLAIQLDTENKVLHGWRQILVDTLSVDDQEWMKELLSELSGWQGRAELESVSYGLVKDFRQEVMDRALGPLYERLEQVESPGFRASKVDNHLENPLWLLVTQRPKHLLNPNYQDWHSLLIASAEAVYQERYERFGTVHDATWSELHTMEIQHPLSKAVSVLGWWLDMPTIGAPGDSKNVVRTQGRAFGASQRMVVSPGQEQLGIFHMATGQSGHPLSPFYRSGHNDWVEGRPSPFLPGLPEYNLTLLPAVADP